ncbi:elicitor-responsive protein 1-like [Prunus yedoensis var. nudiflora]|uniref:Elicitor-responsive protein 1-like n=1 Tax=Prunus yedoensis var. nudiflora TaxID=2094558 RepID=A0A314YYM6_PRUYE|nr:elicitor-responsive protein 1-like [Prunus yedoensis var. nudiflora]
MVGGTLEVTLVEARSLRNMDFIDEPIRCNSIWKSKAYKHHSQRSASGDTGRSPVWNEKFRFDAEYHDGEDHKYMLLFRIMDTRKLLDHDVFVGESKMYVKDVIASGTEKGKAELGVAKYRVVLQDKTYAGEISVALESRVYSVGSYYSFIIKSIYK